jgi:hypothetical protein
MPRSAKEAIPIPPPPERDSLVDAVANLRARMDYVVNVLGLRPGVISGMARMSERLLKHYGTDRWNPALRTVVALDETLDEHMPRWVEDYRRHLERTRSTHTGR